MLATAENDLKAKSLLDRMFEAEFRYMRGEAGVACLAEAFHPDVVVHEPASLPYAGDWCGLDGVAALIRMMGDIWADMSLGDMTATYSGDTLFMTAPITLIARANEKTVIQPFAEVLRFEDGLVIEATPFYSDTHAIVMALQSG